MSKDITEIIDDHCKDYFGHTHWVILSTLSDQEKVGIDEVADIETFNGVQVALYHDDDRKREYTFEMDTAVVEQCKIVADSQEEAEKILLSGDAEWEEVKSQGGDWDCVSWDIYEEEVSDDNINT
tara:strand:- start:401 stop:775 length:375 start_codon:yes stop_codon:yes gene_type:complete